MNCLDARRRIRIADLGELRGTDASLAAHLAGCADCRAESQHVLAGTAALTAALAARRAAPATRRRSMARTLLPAAIAAQITLFAILAGDQRSVAVEPAAPDDSVVSMLPTVAIDTPITRAAQAAKRSVMTLGGWVGGTAAPAAPADVVNTTAGVEDRASARVTLTVRPELIPIRP